MKKCKLCQESKDFALFGREPRVSDGLQAVCKNCKNARNSAWAKANRLKVNKKQNLWRQNNPEKMDTYNNKYQPRKNKTNKIWHSKNKEKNRAYLRARRARIKGSTYEFFTEADLLKKYGSNCYICNDKIDLTASRKIGIPGWEFGLHVEHVMPVSKGGATTIENTRPAHGLCNLRKGSSQIDNISR